MAVDETVAFRDALVDNHLLVSTGVEGIFGRGPVFLDVFTALDRLVTDRGADLAATELRFPPVLPRTMIEATDYLQSFPQLLGSVHAFTGGDREHRALLDALEAGDGWASRLDPAAVVLTPAACYPLYPMSTGRLPEGGRCYSVVGWCFRHEPSPDPARMQSFQMHEFVHLGDAESAEQFRDDWIDRALDLLGSLGLAVEAVVANDPFFGRAGRLLVAGQRAETLKYEIVTPICSTEHPTAICSANCHRDHFGAPFAIETANGDTAHSACVGFGLERCVLALFHTHGTDVDRWPLPVRTRLFG